MTTTILLDLSRTSVRLLEDDGETVTVLGEVAFDDTELDARIADLRQQAGGDTIVLVPRSEVLFCDLDPTGGGDASEEAAIREALEGRTPYALDDLAFDWRRREDRRIAVAAVARETLEEADAFAAAQGFAPTGYGSLGEPSVFDGRVDFGSRGAVKSAARLTPSDSMPAEASTATAAPLPSVAADDESGTRPDSAAEGGPERRAATSEPRDASSLPRSAPRPPVPMRGETPRLGQAAQAPVAAEMALPPDLGTMPPLTAEDRAARLSLPKRPDEAEAITLSSSRLNPPPRRAAKRPSRPVAARLAAALALAALVGAGILLLRAEDSGTASPERVAAVTDMRDSPEEQVASVTEKPAPAAPASPTEVPAETELAEEAAASAPATPALSPEDPLNRPAGAPDSDRYAATGVEARPPATPQPPASDSASNVGAGAPDAEPGLPEEAAALANPSADLPPPPPAPQFSASSGTTLAPGEEPGEPTGEGPRAPSGVTPVIATPPPAAPTEEADIAAAPASLRPARRPETATGTDAQPATDEEGQRTAPEDPESAAGAPNVPVERAGETLRPRARPSAADVTAPTALADTDEATIARLAPRPRPEEAAPDATTEPVPAVVDSAAVAAAAASALEESLPEEPPNPYAVASSLNPRSRPQDLARESAANDDQPSVQVATAATIATPPAPTRPGAAESATILDRLSLGRVNLIGVYGSSSNRRALVRLPSGRFAKVKVGDPVDGGRVRAIGDADLSYVKSGRSVTLQMPRD